MAIEKRLLVKSPVTADGTNPLYDEYRQPIVRESILPVTAKAQVDSLNTKKQPVLKDDIAIVDFDTVSNRIISAKK